MRRLFAILIAAVMCPGLLPASEPSVTVGSSTQEITLTLDDAVSLALRENRDVLLQSAEVEKAKRHLAEAQSLRRPTVTLGAAWETTRELYTKDIPAVSGQASFTQPLYQGGAIVSAIRQAESGITVEEAVLEGAKLDTVLLVQKGFFTLLLARQLSALNRRIMENSREHLAIAYERYKKGEAARSEVLEAESRHSATEDAYRSSLAQADSSRAALNAVLSLDPSVRIVPDGRFMYDQRTMAYDEAFAKALAARPQMREQEARVETQKHALEIARSEGRPAVSASWDYYSRSRNALGFTPTKGWNDYNVLGLVVSWPVFDGWRTRARVEQETLGLKQAHLARDKVRADIALEVKQSHLAVADAISGIRASEADILVYRDNLAAARERFEQGVVSFTGLSDAELKYRIAAFNRDQAIFDYIIAKSTLEKATGGAS